VEPDRNLAMYPPGVNGDECSDDTLGIPLISIIVYLGHLDYNLQLNFFSNQCHI
jgi:hypothetical protein